MMKILNGFPSLIGDLDAVDTYIGARAKEGRYLFTEK